MEHIMAYIKQLFNPYILLILCFSAGVVIYYYITNRRIENFQEPSGPAVAAGSVVKLPKETCLQLKSQIDQYLQVRQQYKDTVILNLDETIVSLEKYFREYGCELHSY